MNRKMVSVVFLMSAVAGVGVTTVINNSLFVLAQCTLNSTSQCIVKNSAASSNTGKQANVNRSATSNATSVGPPAKPIIVGPSSVNASPITSEIQGNASSTFAPQNNGTFLGSR
jgi:hypothetical protein